jgi:phosphomannomutase
MTVAIDVANGMAAYTMPPVLERLRNVTTHSLFMQLDGTFPNHEANPLKEENLRELKKLVTSKGCEVGLAFDGDADRCCFLDETGATLSSDLMTALLAPGFLAGHKGAPVVYDLRSSWVVKEEIARAGGVPVRDRVGHSFIKATMRANGAVFGGELSGHFYFADNYVCDSGEIAFVSALSMLSQGPQKLSQRAQKLRRYSATGELNFVVADKDAAIARLSREFAGGRQDRLDGITVEFGDLSSPDWWWFNVRASNTEPLLRLNLEAKTAAIRDQRRAQLLGLLGTPEH